MNVHPAITKHSQMPFVRLVRILFMRLFEVILGTICSLIDTFFLFVVLYYAEKYTGSSVTTKQVMQLHDYCLCLLASRRQSIDISSQEDHFFRPSKMRPIPSNFPHVSVTSLKRADLIFSRHLADALSVIPTLDALATKLNKTNQPLAIVDVGSGGGLPGIVIAIMRPHYSVTAVDTVGKKCEVRYTSPSLSVYSILFYFISLASFSF